QRLSPLVSTLCPYTTLFRSRARVTRIRGTPAGRCTPRRSSLPLPRALLERRVVRRPKAERTASTPGLGTRPGDARFHERCRAPRSEEHTSELQSRVDLVCRL